jgi:hypothetical protein
VDDADAMTILPDSLDQFRGRCFVVISSQHTGISSVQAAGLAQWAPK